jgi:ApaG protein
MMNRDEKDPLFYSFLRWQSLASAPYFVCNGLMAAPACKEKQGTEMATYEFTVSVKTKYLADQSVPERSKYVFAYTVTIRNTGHIAAQLISRHWVIVDANNHIEEVRGLGVIGHQPLLQPGEQFEYTSGTAIATPNGTMAGKYFCVAEDGERFEAKIPEFELSLPRTLH